MENNHEEILLKALRKINRLSKQKDVCKISYDAIVEHGLAKGKDSAEGIIDKFIQNKTNAQGRKESHYYFLDNIHIKKKFPPIERHDSQYRSELNHDLKRLQKIRFRQPEQFSRQNEMTG